MHVTTGTRWVRSLMIVTLVLGAAACSGDPPPAGAVKTSTPTASSATPTPTPSVTPVDQQIEATMRAYFEAANSMFRTGQVSELESFSAASCPCRKITRDVAKVVADGGRYKGTRYLVKRMTVHDVIADSAAVEVTAGVPPYKVISGSGRVLENSSGGELHTDFSLIREGTRWVVTNAVNLG
jgi:hypothetical protein